MPLCFRALASSGPWMDFQNPTRLTTVCNFRILSSLLESVGTACADIHVGTTHTHTHKRKTNKTESSYVCCLRQPSRNTEFLLMFDACAVFDKLKSVYFIDIFSYFFFLTFLLSSLSLFLLFSFSPSL